MTGTAIQQMVAYFGQDIQRVNHALKVFGYAKAIAEGEGLGGDDLAVAEVAAVLHDIGIPESLRRFGSDAGHHQEQTGEEVARPLLEELECPSDLAERILFLIGHHHSYHTQGEKALQVLFEADFLVNLEEGNLPELTPARAGERFFRTGTGRSLLGSLYGV